MSFYKHCFVRIVIVLFDCFFTRKIKNYHFGDNITVNFFYRLLNFDCINCSCFRYKTLVYKKGILI